MKKTKIVNIKMTAEEHDQITEKANEETKGNISAWLIAAALRYRPRKGEVLKAKGTSKPKVDNNAPGDEPKKNGTSKSA